ncbi:amidohydrolase [Paenibacillus sabinae]|uniref:Amidohydrolase n=1 Tax=Paenibacillus sabinae T27 TaxID=1268072 RepID=X4ZW88_9BACL|nr:amidohydrolase [Paenibacillus sabinae]AHV95994.1 amidohydrolase [Paenibacillus sabinae T27]
MTEPFAIESNKELTEKLVQARRELHRHPELAEEEYETTGKLRQWLTGAGISILDLPLKTGLIAEIGSGEPKVALRADIDALPIAEETGLPFSSAIPGKMHACGHDFHTAVILGAAYLLKSRERELQGTVRILFQPAEETGAGAPAVLASGGLSGVSAIFGLHSNPDLPSGSFGTRTGALTAGVDCFVIAIRGTGAHAAQPERGEDSILAAAHIVTALQSIASRLTPAGESVVVSVTQINGGTTWNVLPELVELKGTVRTHNEQIRSRIPGQIRQIINGIAAASGTSAELKWIPGPPATVNSGRWADFAKQQAAEFGYSVHDLAPQMIGEDFAYYLREISGAFVNIGTGGTYSQHHPKFDTDESALLPAAQYFAGLAEAALKELVHFPGITPLRPRA